MDETRPGRPDSHDETRAISTVADVSVALLVVAVCITVLVTGLTGADDTHTPVEAAHTAETLGTSTVTVNYSLAPVVTAAAANSERVTDPQEYDTDSLRRFSHAPALGHLARAAVFGLGFDTPTGRERLVPSVYEPRADERIQTSLVASSFETNATAVWRPFANASILGKASVGDRPPARADTSLVRVTVPSEFPSVRAEAVAAVDGDDEYGVVADIVARAVVEGQFPLPATQRVLEGDGPERDVAVYRYLRTADLVSGASRSDPAVADNLDREDADATVLNNYLIDYLATQLEADLAATFDTAAAAARAVSVGEVTISVTTWDRQ